MIETIQEIQTEWLKVHAPHRFFQRAQLFDYPDLDICDRYKGKLSILFLTHRIYVSAKKQDYLNNLLVNPSLFI